MEQKQLSSNTKIKKKRTSVLHPFSAHFKNQTTRRTVDSVDLLSLNVHELLSVGSRILESLAL